MQQEAQANLSENQEGLRYETLRLRQRRPAAEDVKRLHGQGISPLLAHLFAARGVKDAEEVRAGLDKLIPVDRMKNAREMGSILADCVDNRKRVLIVSDYDCDGATAGSVLIRAFRACGMNFDYLVPDRLKHGYGLTPSIVEEAAELDVKPDFIITVDNGISSTYGVDRARELGIEVLVTDHHLPPDVLPEARLIVNPNQVDCPFESKGIAGCGVAWYVARALHDELKKRGKEPGFEPEHLLQYVAIGTVADVVPLDFNNRILVREGLERIRRGECSYGIQAIAEVAKKPLETLSCQDIGFGLGPRINAAGRLAHMSAGIECLTTESDEKAKSLAVELDEINQERRDLQKGMVEQAVIQAETYMRQQNADFVGADKCVVVYSPDWHEGVVGVVAGRLKEEMHRPTFVLCDAQDGNVKGSGRSIPGFHLKHALDKINIRHPGLLMKFGGHAMAAGVTVERGRANEFREALAKVCEEDLTPEMLERRVDHDGALPARLLQPSLISEMQMQVWGQGFEQPLFVDQLQVISSRTMGEDGTHLKIVVDKGGEKFDIVAFGDGPRQSYLPEQLQLAYQPTLNVFRGEVKVQMMANTLLNVPKLDLRLQAAQAAERLASKNEPAQSAQTDLFGSSADNARKRGFRSGPR